jgi:protein arginine kinase
VVSTRVRLARNIAGRPFLGRNSPADRERVVRLVEAAVEDTPALGEAAWHRLDTLGRPGRLWLHERQLASRDLAGLDASAKVRSGAAVLAAESWAVLCNEEDHLRIHALSAGLALETAWDVAEGVDTELGRRISFAFHPEFGYLTGCPTNVGTGLRASVLIHLPALVLTREIGKVLQGLAQVGLTHRGLWGEGSEVRGNLFQLSNQTTLGKSEAELLDHLGRLVEEVMGHEARAREVLKRDAPALVEDRVWRAWGLLRSARILHYEELLNLLSGVRLGVGMGLLPTVDWGVQNRLLVVAQDGHLARSAETGLEDEALPVHRASLVRRMLDGETPG